MSSKSIRVEGLATDYPAGAVIESHAHDVHQIVHAVAGVMRVSAEGATWIVPPGRGLWVPATTLHMIRCVSEVKLRTVYLKGASRTFPKTLRVTNVSNLMREIMVRIAEAEEPRKLHALTELLVDEIAALGVEPLEIPILQNHRLEPLAAALERDPADARSLEDWAARLGMSRRTLIRQVRSATGMSFREYRRQIRIVSALEHLAQGKSVTEVALDMGFESPSAFVQAFKQVTGQTPGRYLRSRFTT